ncbi:MAG: hypothetical protein AMXMBFR33_02670 [Candidatus Xenobia bacterium]|jgi:hypothetical protein
MEIRGPNFQGYDAAHIGAVQRELARSVKPNVLRQLETLDDEQKLHYLLTTDTLDLSPDAREYLYKLRKRMRDEGKSKGFAYSSKQDFEALLSGLESYREDLQREEYEGQQEELPSEPVFPSIIQLSSYVPRQPGAPTTAGSESGSSSSPTAEVLQKMIRHAPSGEARNKIVRELEPMGLTIVQKMKQWGLNVIVLEKQMALTDLTIKGMKVVAPGERTFDGRPWSVVRGLYDQSRRLLVVGEELLGNQGRSAARHEFAHAYDHYVQDKESRTHPLSVQLYNRFARERSGKVSQYAEVNPQEWFAESVEAFFEAGARDILRHKDPLMFDYLTQLFAS